MLRRTRDYIGRPAVFFHEQLRNPPDWWLAAAGPILCSCLLGIAATVLSHRARGVQVDLLRYLDLPEEMLPPPVLMTIAVMLGYPAWFGMALFALLSMNVLYRDAAKPARLAEFTGLCFLTQLPLCVITIGIALGHEPEPFRSLPSMSRSDELTAFLDRQNAAPALIVIRTLSYASALWLASQLTVALKVAGGFSTRAAFISALFLTMLFAGMQFVFELL